MQQVLCAVDERQASAEAVRTAIDYCRARGLGMTLVGVVRPMLAVAQPAHGELARRFGEVESKVIEAARAARAQGVAVQKLFRAGEPAEELMREAHAVGAEDVFLASQRNPLAAAVTRSPRVTVTHVAVPARRPATDERLRAVA